MKRSEKQIAPLSRGLGSSLLRASLLGGILLAIPLGGCASTQRAERPEPPKLRGWDDFKRAAEDEPIWLGGQPSEAALARFAAESGGRGLVVNLRTDEEMAFLPYYQRSVAAHGLGLVHMPIKGSELDRPEVEAYAQVMAEHDGPVLLHCASGGRASYIWVMDKMRSEGWSSERAADWLTAYYDKPPGERGASLLTRYESQRDGDLPQQ